MNADRKHLAVRLLSGIRPTWSSETVREMPLEVGRRERRTVSLVCAQSLAHTPYLAIAQTACFALPLWAQRLL